MAGGRILQIAERDLGTGRCELQLEGELDLGSEERLQAVLVVEAAKRDADDFADQVPEAVLRVGVVATDRQ